MSKIKKAVIIHGPGRSGTTLLNNILSLHPDLGWISGYLNRYPTLPSITMFNLVMNWQWFEKLVRNKRFFPRPSEAYDFWDHYFPGFSKDDLTQQHIDSLQLFRCQNAIENILRFSGKRRFITKLTGMSRYVILEQLFEDLTIVYINRDPRAVVASYWKQKWDYKAKPQEFLKTPQTDLIEHYCKLYLRFYQSREELMKFNLIEVKYEELINNPVTFFSSLLPKLELSVDKEFIQLVKSWRISKDTNSSWRKELSPEAQLIMESRLGNVIQELDYNN